MTIEKNNQTSYHRLLQQEFYPKDWNPKKQDLEASLSSNLDVDNGFIYSFVSSIEQNTVDHFIKIYLTYIFEKLHIEGEFDTFYQYLNSDTTRKKIEELIAQLHTLALEAMKSNTLKTTEFSSLPALLNNLVAFLIDYQDSNLKKFLFKNTNFKTVDNLFLEFSHLCHFFKNSLIAIAIDYKIKQKQEELNPLMLAKSLYNKSSVNLIDDSWMLSNFKMPEYFVLFWASQKPFSEKNCMLYLLETNKLNVLESRTLLHLLMTEWVINKLIRPISNLYHTLDDLRKVRKTKPELIERFRSFLTKEIICNALKTLTEKVKNAKGVHASYHFNLCFFFIQFVMSDKNTLIHLSDENIITLFRATSMHWFCAPIPDPNPFWLEIKKINTTEEKCLWDMLLNTEAFQKRLFQKGSKLLYELGMSHPKAARYLLCNHKQCETQDGKTVEAITKNLLSENERSDLINLVQKDDPEFYKKKIKAQYFYKENTPQGSMSNNDSTTEIAEGNIKKLDIPLSPIIHPK